MTKNETYILYINSDKHVQEEKNPFAHSIPIMSIYLTTRKKKENTNIHFWFLSFHIF